MKRYKWLFVLFLGLPMIGRSQTNCINFCNDVYKDIIQYRPHYDLGIVHYDYTTSDVDFHVGHNYKIKLTHVGGSYICQNPQMDLAGSTVVSDVEFNYSSAGQFRFYFHILGTAPGEYEEFDVEIHKRDLGKGGIMRKRKTFKIFVNVICAWEFTASPYTNTSVYGRKFEAGNYIRGNGAFTNSNTGFISFDAGNYVEWNSSGTTGGFSTKVTNGYIEAYIDGCGGMKSGVVEEMEVTELLPQDEMKVSLSPNPANSYATVSFDDGDSEKHIRLYDASGRLLQEQVTQENEFRLDVSNERNGLYFIHVEENGQRTVLKMIKE